MFYCWLAGLAKHYRNDIKTKRAVLYVVGCEKITGGSGQSGLLGGGDGRLGGLESFGGFGSYLDKDDRAVAINHNQIDFAGFAGEVAGEGFEAFAYKMLLAAFFTPSAEQFRIGQ